MSELLKSNVSKGLYGDDEYRGAYVDANIGAYPTKKTGLTAGISTDVGQGTGYVSGNASPYVQAEIGPLNIKAQRNFYAGRDRGFNYHGRGADMVGANMDLPVAGGNLNFNINKTLDRFTNTVSGGVRFTTEF